MLHTARVDLLHAHPSTAPYRREGDVTLIEIELSDTRQLFNTLDPAPFVEKDLDHDADTYIVDAAREIGARHAKRMVVHLPAALADTPDARALPQAVHAYFGYRARHIERQLRESLREGVISLAIGLAFLATCLTLRRIVEPLAWGEAGATIGEGLLIMGWVAMWRPIQLFLYDWWPIRRQLRLLREIAQMPIDVRSR